MVNFGSKTYAAEMVAALTTVRERMRATCHNRRIVNYKIASVVKLLGWEEGVNQTTTR